MSDSTPKLEIRRQKPRVSNLQTAVIGIVVIAFVCYLVFGGGLPFTGSGFELKAVFTSNTDLHIPSPVRIAGVQVGEVTGVERIKGSPNAGIVVMQIDNSGLPIHADATADIRSRIFLEGNFYVDLHPGTPESRILHSGATLPAANTSGPVQLDRILSSLDTSARANLQKLVQGFGAALNKPRRQRRTTGAQGLNNALKYSADSFEASAIVNQALLGTHSGDLSGVVKGESKIFKGLAASGAQLPELVDSFDHTMGALAAHQQDLSAAVAALPAVLRATIGADKALDASFAPTDAFAKALTPSIKQLGTTINVTLPWLQQLTKLNSPSELEGLLKELTPAVSNTSAAVRATTSLISRGREALGVLQQGAGPDGQREDHGRQLITERAGRLPAAVPERRRPHRRDPELRRQRPLRARHRWRRRHRIKSGPAAAGRCTAMRCCRRRARFRHSRPSGKAPALNGRSCPASRKRRRTSTARPRGGAVKHAIKTHPGLPCHRGAGRARDRDGRLHPRASAVVHLRPQLLPGQRRVRDRRGGRPRARASR